MLPLRPLHREFLLTSMREIRPQWSYKKGLAAGALPAKAYEREFNCNSPIPSFSDLSEAY